MNKSSVLNRLRSKKKYFFEKYSIKELALFGSVARNENDEDSDIDLLVDFTQPIGIRFIDLANELESFFNSKVDLVSKGGIKPAYLEYISRDLVYA